MKESVRRAVAAIVVLRTCGYRALARRDAALARELAEERRALTLNLASRFGGREAVVRDAALWFVFTRPEAAFEFAVATRSAFARRDRAQPRRRRIALRLAVHFDEPGVALEAARTVARLQALAAPGEIALTGPVYDRVRPGLEELPSLDERRTLRHRGRPVRIYRLAPEAGARPGPSVRTTPRSLRRLQVRLRRLNTPGLPGALMAAGALGLAFQSAVPTLLRALAPATAPSHRAPAGEAAPTPEPLTAASAIERLREIEDSLISNPEPTRARLAYAELQLRAAQRGWLAPSAAVVAADRVLRGLPETPEWLRLRALRRLRHERDAAGADDDLRLALESRPDWAEGLTALGELSLARGDFDRARRAFRRAQAQGGRAPDALIGLVQADYFTGNLSSATHRLRTALGAEPDSPLWNAWLGRLLLARRQPRAAIPHLERALAVDPDAAGVIARLGIARARADDPKAAAAALAALDERARAGGPRSSEARALLLLELGRPDEAVEALEEAWRAGEPGLLHLSHDPELHRLRAHPRFSKLVARARSH